ncbi:MAG: hypothetical protein MR598_02980 [Erysipelotrichaceae bacterium]|nr:hypothetical protein [Erysipelotrichaceae bacterium]
MKKRIVVHRVTNIQKVRDELYFYTKGDANLTEDNYKIPEENVVGVVKVKILWIGYPTVVLSEL